MSSINLGRVIVGGILAGALCFVGDGIVHDVLLSARWSQIMVALGKSGSEVGRQYPGYFFAYDLLKGLAATWIYAAIRPRFGAGPATALVAAIVVWFLVIPVPLIELLPMEFFGRGFAALWSLYGIIPIVLGTLAGAWLYREGDR